MLLSHIERLNVYFFLRFVFLSFSTLIPPVSYHNILECLAQRRYYALSADTLRLLAKAIQVNPLAYFLLVFAKFSCPKHTHSCISQPYAKLLVNPPSQSGNPPPGPLKTVTVPFSELKICITRTSNTCMIMYVHVCVCVNLGVRVCLCVCVRV